MKLLLISMIFLVLFTYINSKSISKRSIKLQCNKIEFENEPVQFDASIFVNTSRKYVSTTLRFDPSRIQKWSVFQSTSAKSLRMFRTWSGRSYKFLTLRNGNLELTEENSEQFKACNGVFELVDGKLMQFTKEKFLFCSADIKKICDHYREAKFVEIL